MNPVIKDIVETQDSFAGKAFDISSQLLILYSLICFSIETLPNLPHSVTAFLEVNEVIVVALFTIEYLLRVWVSDSSKHFIFSFFGIIDLISILPFYLGLSADLRSVRALRFVRLIRLIKLARYNKSLEHFRKAFNDIKVDLVLFTSVTIILLYIASVGIYHFEHAAQPDNFKSIFDAMWWSVATLTTVGYGDIYPITAGGKLFTFFVLLLGLGVVAVPTGLISAALTNARSQIKEN